MSHPSADILRASPSRQRQSHHTLRRSLARPLPFRGESVNVAARRNDAGKDS